MEHEAIRSLPKVVLHEHLDGSLRPATVLELAGEIGYRGLPTADVDDLAAWFDQRGSGSLVRYLDAFAHTIAVMQTPSALARAGREAIVDLAADGVVYAEIRFAPSLHTEHGLTRSEVLESVLGGLGAAAQESGVEFGVIVDAMRQSADSAAVARVAADFAGAGVVGFDLAGPETGFPPTDHLEAIEIARAAGLGLTIHAGEAAGLDSITAALDCGTRRLGHGVRIIDDCTVRDGAVQEVGPVATRVLLEGVVLEVCPSSNLGTGAFRSIEAHPIGLLHRAGFRVTVNTDNRLMSMTTMTAEFEQLVEHHGFTAADIAATTEVGIEAAFCDAPTRRRLLERVRLAYPPT